MDLYCEYCNECSYEEQFVYCEHCKQPIDLYCLSGHITKHKLLPEDECEIFQKGIEYGSSLNDIPSKDREVCDKIGLYNGSSPDSGGRTDDVYFQEFCPYCNGHKITDTMKRQVLTIIGGYNDVQVEELCKEFISNEQIHYSQYGDVISVTEAEKSERAKPMLDIIHEQSKMLKTMQYYLSQSNLKLVRYIDDGNVKLTTGRVYTVRNEEQDTYTVLNDSGEESRTLKDRFEVITIEQSFQPVGVKPEPLKVVYDSDVGYFDGLTRGRTYEVTDETDDQYVIAKNDLGAQSKISKSKFKVVK